MKKFLYVISLCGLAICQDTFAYDMATVEEMEKRIFNIVGKRPIRRTYAPGYAPFEMVELKGDPSRRGETSERNTALTCPTTSKPVVIATGEKFKDEFDFSGIGEYGIGLDRTYRSKQVTGTLFGPNWLSTLDIPKLKFSMTGCVQMPNGQCVPHEVVFTDSTGAEYTYTRGAYEGGSEHPYVGRDGSFLLYQYGQSWMLHRGKEYYHYGSNAKVQFFSDGYGIKRTYSYDGSGQVSRISNQAGVSVQLAWTNGRVTQVTDPAGEVWSYAYDGNNMLSQVTSPGGSNRRQYHYESSDPTLLTGISINDVRYSTYSYDANKRVFESALAGREEVDRFVYGTNFTQVTDARNQTTTYTFATVLGDKKVTDISRSPTASCSAAASKTVYDANGFIDYTLDWNQNKTDYTYAANSKLQSVTTAAGTTAAMTTTYTWTGEDITGIALGTPTTPAYATVQQIYETVGSAAGRIKRIVRSDKVTDLTQSTDFEYAFHSNGVLASVVTQKTLPNGVATETVSYDTRGNMIGRVNPLSQSESWSDHNGRGQPGTYVDLNGVASTYEYYPNGDLAAITQSGNRVTRLTYNGDRQLASVTYPTGRKQSYQYNAAGRLENVKNALEEPVNNILNITANTVGTNSVRKVPGLNGATLNGTISGAFSSTTQLDSLGRPYTAFGNNSQRIDYRYDGNGNVVSRTDAANRKTSYEYDAQDRLFLTTAPDGGQTRMEYGANGLLKAVVDPRTLRTTYEYNGFGSLTKLTSPDTGVTTFDYDTAGRLKSETRQDGKVINYTWDALDRMLSRSSGGVTESFTYDGGTFGKGKLTRFDDATGQTTYAYNEAGLLVSQTNSVYGQVLTTTWTYDSSGRLIGMTYPTGLALIYEYDSHGRVSSVKTGSQLHN